MGYEFGLIKIGSLEQNLCTLVGLVGMQFGCSWLHYHLLIHNNGTYTISDALAHFDMAILMGYEFGLIKIGSLGQKLCTLVGLVVMQFGCSWLSYHLSIHNDGTYTISDASTRFDMAILMGYEFGLT